MSDDPFKKGAVVEICSDDEGLRGAWFAATVLRGKSRKNKVFVEYKTLVANERGNKPLREFVDVVNVRPVPPREIGRRFEFSEEVDAYHRDGWWEGVVTRVVAGGERFVVYFRAAKEEIEFGFGELRLHREWVDGDWKPAFEEGHEQQLEDEVVEEKQAENMPSGLKINRNGNSSKLSLEVNKIENSSNVTLGNNENGNSSKVPVDFTEGMFVEVSSDDDGFVGAWFTAKIVKAIGETRYLVEYQTLRTDDETELLKEEMDALHIRPIPPVLPEVDFSRLEKVDAMYNEAWWVGVISKVLSGQKYYVYFKESKEELEFGHSDMRLHQDWVDGRWVRLSEMQNTPSGLGINRNGNSSELPPEVNKNENSSNVTLENNENGNSSKVPVDFTEGMIVEVSSDDDGFVGAWFTAKIVKAIGENRYLVEYQTLRTDDETELLKEEMDALHIRPPPPVLPEVDFNRLEEVDAMYNEAWWVGVISKVLSGKKYYVYFKESKEELEFGHSDLRLHQDWIEGRWVRLSEALNI